MVTGSRGWTDREAISDAMFRVMRDDEDMVLVVGDCPTGADAIAEDIARNELPYAVEKHRADWRRYGIAAGPMRNQRMVDQRPDVCLAFPLDGSRGTWDAVRRARAAGIRVEVAGRTIDAMNDQNAKLLDPTLHDRCPLCDFLPTSLRNYGDRWTWVHSDGRECTVRRGPKGWERV